MHSTAPPALPARLLRLLRRSQVFLLAPLLARQRCSHLPVQEPIADQNLLRVHVLVM